MLKTFAPFALLFVSSSFGAGAFSVDSFSPEGVVKGVRQVRVHFTEQMVPFGDPRAVVSPFDITCAEKGSGRWADGKNWSYDFDRDLPAGVNCSFKLRKGLKSLDGGEPTGKTEFAFSTGGPSVLSTLPYEGSHVQEDQVFVLALDAEADKASILANARFLVDGIASPIAFKFIEGAQREELLKADGLKYFHYSRRRGAKRGKVTTTGEDSKLIYIIQPTQKFPPNSKVSLVWGAGITSLTGAKTDEDQTLHWQTRREFAANFSCERENAQAPCIPFTAMSLSFTSEVSWEMAKQIKLVAPGGKVFKPFDQAKGDDSQAVYSMRFDGPFPEKTNFHIVLPKGFKDDTGRLLANANSFPLEVATGPYPPMVKFAAEFGIIESKSDPALPVTLRAIEPSVKARMGLHQVSKKGTEDAVDGKVLRLGTPDIVALRWWTAAVNRQMSYDHRGESILSMKNDEKTQISEFEIKKPGGPRAFEVVGIPLQKPGLYVVEIESKLLGKSLLGVPRPMYVSATALVTNMSVHFKRGRESSLAWVTALDTGKPVPGAHVGVRDCRGNLLASGKTDSNGLLYIGQEINEGGGCSQPLTGYYSELDRGLFVFAEKDDDFSFSHTNWKRGIEPWRFSQPTGSERASKLARTVFDRTLFRAGETVHMKHYVRRHVMSGFQAFKNDDLPKVAQVRHQGSGQKYEMPVKWDSFGIAESTFVIPKGAKLGEYSVTLLKEPQLKAKQAGEEEGEQEGEGEEGYHYNYGGGGGYPSGDFRVEEYRVPLMKGKIRGPSEKLVSPTEATIDFTVEYLAGGGASNLPVQLRYQQNKGGGTHFPEFEGFYFGGGAVHEEKQRGSYMDDEEDGGDAGKTPNLQKITQNLDKNGTGRAVLKGFTKSETSGSIEVEMEYRDPNGETQTVSSSIPTYPALHLVGIKPDSWYATKSGIKFYSAVADLSGKAVRGASVEVELIERKTFSHRKKLVGGFYAYEHKSQLISHGKVCSGKTDAKGLLICDVVPDVSGNIFLQAKTTDPSGNVSYSNTSMWIYDKDDWWFEQDDNDRMDVLAEKKNYEPGDKAQFQVRMPFREATALVTVEREGVMDAYLVPIAGKKPVVEIPIKKNYAPNVYVSVMAVRGRVAGTQPTALLDLGKPAYKLGVSGINVGWKGHELKVKVTPADETYHVREKAKVAIEVQTADGDPLPKGSEIALAAVDEGLLLLKNNDSWQLLANMMNNRGWEVETSTAQMQVVGKRHFGLKALPNGGDGGKSPTRELFDTLLTWKARVPLSSDGKATVEVPLNDSLSAFKIVAVASGGLDRFGTGSSTIRATQDLMIFPSIPQLVREGDKLPAAFTMRNATQKPMDVLVTAKAKNLNGTFESKSLSLGSGESKIISWTVEIPYNIGSVEYEVEAKVTAGASKGATDHLKITQKVVEATPVHVYQGTIAQVERPIQMKVARPTDAIPGKGGVHVIVQPTILTGLNGVRLYMEQYPYTCLEQRTSKAVALESEDLWKRIANDLPSYLSGSGLARYFPDCPCESDTLTSYVISVADEAGYEIPSSSHRRMTDALTRFVEGSLIVGSPLPTADLTIRKIAALEALSRSGQSSWRLMSSLEIAPNLWPTSAVIDYLNVLRRTKDVPEREMRLKAAEQILRSRLNFQGTIMGFSTEKTDYLWWLMVGADMNANRMVLTMLNEPTWKEDMPRLMRGAIFRQKQGHWDTTTANAWGVLATRKFANTFEKDKVTGTTHAKLDSGSQDIAWSALPKGKTLKFGWPEGQRELEVSHSGGGKPWATIQSLAAIPLKQPLSTGYKITKRWDAVERKKPGTWSKGDVIRVHLDLEAQADMTWVVLADPIPSGASILGSGLGNDSNLRTQGETREGWVWPAFEERTMEAFRAYYQFVPKGKWTVEYTVRLNESGTLQMPTSRLEAMYAPEMFGENPNPTLTIQE